MVEMDARRTDDDVQLSGLTAQLVESLHAAELGRVREVASLVTQRIARVKERCDLYLSSMQSDLQGELGKILVFIQRRQRREELDSKVRAAAAMNGLRWERFALELCASTGTGGGMADITARVLSHEEDAAAMQSVASKARRLGLRALSAVRLSTSHGSGVCVSTATASDSLKLSEVLVSLCAALRAPAARPSTGRVPALSPQPGIALSSSGKASATAAQSKPSPTLLPDTFLSTRAIEWMHLPSYNPLHWDRLLADSTLGAEGDFDRFLHRFCVPNLSFLATSSVYFCIEERAASCAKHSADAADASSRVSQLQVHHCKPVLSPAD